MQTFQPQLDELTDLISSWHGLTSDTDPALATDCLPLLDLLGDAHKLVDVGSGTGMPGLVLKIARPDLAVTLIEASQRKAAFLVHASSKLHLESVEVIRLRAEEAGRHGRLRESFDVAVARALAEMYVLAELCLPLVRIGGRLLAMKTDVERELAVAEKIIDRLGGRVVEVRPAPTQARENGQIVVIEKVEPTPPEFPRRPGVPSHRPMFV
ncbi:MAG TPA: 16S rRNA (guanine(527)-N(7))-methyltransferase RsmG [Candidatus Dormibacteraeota bacterium]|jgi:16S rRNA (guanine527-N7)-methyltransferase|nr:16S rRNA (guanine(527)-N(7))-methyltransferase RsmG [Candidatus Dormibacteraeota bacterium]